MADKQEALRVALEDLRVTLQKATPSIDSIHEHGPQDALEEAWQIMYDDVLPAFAALSAVTEQQTEQAQSDADEKYWVILHRPGLVPMRKGPFYEARFTEKMLRELYELYPDCICDVIYTRDDIYPQSGREWLAMYGDKRRKPLPECAAPSAAPVQDERETFQKTINEKRFFPAELDFTRTESPSGRDEYANGHLQSAWYGWQLRAALAAHPADQYPDATKMMVHPAQQMTDEREALKGLLVEIADFPEINERNYSNDDVAKLNEWGVMVYERAEKVRTALAAAPAQQPTDGPVTNYGTIPQPAEISDEQIARAARALADRNAELCNVDKEDNWNIYADDFIADAKAMFAALASKGDE